MPVGGLGPEPRRGLGRKADRDHPLQNHLLVVIWWPLGA